MSKQLRIHDLINMKQAGEKIACLTSYDATFAKLQEQANLDVLLVGDSLGMVLHGCKTTLQVSMADMIYHTRLVSHVTSQPLIISDMPFMSYQNSSQALGNAARLVAEGGAHMVKLEGSELILDSVQLIVNSGIPVCGHLGLTPQSIHELGGYKVQGKTDEDAEALLEQAKALEQAGVSCIVLECIPQKVAATISNNLGIPTIGIGAGVDCDGQVLVTYDMLGMTEKQPSFSKNFLIDQDSILTAFKCYVKAVKDKTFPAAEHGFN